uniref:Uncharacterized protein n=1 Tax=viral metagenome TaxID=1070528 RepID=A0A6C0I0B0_9ZZZZ
MQHLASPLFLRHLVSNSPELAESLQAVMHAIYVCNTAYYGWYQYYDADVFSHMSIFLGEQFTIYAPIPPYVEGIGQLNGLEFYDKWLTHYNIYSRLQWLIYTAAILKKKINKKIPLSYRDALINNGGVVKETSVYNNPPLIENTLPLKISCIQLVFNKKYILSNSIAAFLGKKKY